MNKSNQEPLDKGLFFDVQDMVKALKCSARHITNLRKRREIPLPVKFGARILWPRKTVEDWVAAGCPALAV